MQTQLEVNNIFTGRPVSNVLYSNVRMRLQTHVLQNHERKPIYYKALADLGVRRPHAFPHYSC
jgi:hypothetical protein